MILAAGRGARLQSLTDEIPKPLIQIENKPLIAHQLLRLSEVGIKDIVINVSYRAKQIIDTLGNGDCYGVNLEYSFEPSPLETGGGICQALHFFGSEPFIVLSADIWTTYPLEKLLKHPLGSTQSHLILVDNPDYHPKGDFHLLPNKLLDLNGSPKYTFANLGLYHPELFKDCKPEVFPLSDILYKQINQRKITGEHYSGKWFNIGTLNELTRLETYLQQKNK